MVFFFAVMHLGVFQGCQSETGGDEWEAEDQGDQEPSFGADSEDLSSARVSMSWLDPQDGQVVAKRTWLRIAVDVQSTIRLWRIRAELTDPLGTTRRYGLQPEVGSPNTWRVRTLWIPKTALNGTHSVQVVAEARQDANNKPLQRTWTTKPRVIRVVCEQDNPLCEGEPSVNDAGTIPAKDSGSIVVHDGGPIPIHDSGTAGPTTGLFAFPGAEGFGRNSLGGRGGQILRVTNLKDSGEGSLRAACSASGPRIVVFDVSGTIALESTIEIRNPRLTIAGQTAPGGGIALRGYGLEIRVSDVVVRHIRFRTGSEKSNVSQGLNIHDASNVVIDHCSLTWAVDENAGLGGTAHDITIQRSVIGEGLYNAGHPDGTHHSAGFISNAGNTNISLHHNLFVHNNERNPRIHGGLIDFRNNIIHNFGSWCGLVGNESASIRLNWIGNFVQKGTSSGGKRSIGFKPGIAQVFVQDNIDPYRSTGTEDEWSVVSGDKPTYQSLTLFPVAPVTTHRAKDLMTMLLDDVGATRPARDSVDARLVANVRARNGSMIDHPSQVGGWPNLQQDTALPDRDNDGMPDPWEAAHGFNPDNKSDGPQDADGDGYTNVEEYLNSL